MSPGRIAIDRPTTAAIVSKVGKAGRSSRDLLTLKTIAPRVFVYQGPETAVAMPARSA